MHIYIRKIIFTKIQFETHNDCDFPVSEDHFIQLWLERLKEDEGYGKTVRNALKEFMPTQKTVMGLIEAIADFIHRKDDPDAIINSFKQKGQHLSEPLQSYVVRKQTEARTVMLDGHSQSDGGNRHSGNR